MRSLYLFNSAEGLESLFLKLLEIFRAATFSTVSADSGHSPEHCGTAEVIRRGAGDHATHQARSRPKMALGGDLRWLVGRARFAIEEVMRRYNITEYIGNLLNLAGEARRAGTGEGLSVR
jgi:hypothetical protein